MKSFSYTEAVNERVTGTGKEEGTKEKITRVEL